MSGDSEGNQPIPHEVIDRLDWQSGKGIARPYNRGGGGGGAVYRDRETYYVPTSDPKQVQAMEKLAWETQQQNLLASRPGHKYVSYEEHVAELRREKERQEAAERAELERRETAERRARERQRLVREARERTAREEREELFAIARKGIEYWQQDRSPDNAGVISALIGDIETARKGMEYCRSTLNHEELGLIAALIGDTKTAQEAIEKYNLHLRKRIDSCHAIVGSIAALIGDIETARKGIAYALENKDGYGSHKKAGEIAALIGDIKTATKVIEDEQKQRHSVIAGEIAAWIGNVALAKTSIVYYQEKGWYGWAGILAGRLIWAMNRR